MNTLIILCLLQTNTGLTEKSVQLTEVQFIQWSEIVRNDQDAFEDQAEFEQFKSETLVDFCGQRFSGKTISVLMRGGQ